MCIRDSYDARHAIALSVGRAESPWRYFERTDPTTPDQGDCFTMSQNAQEAATFSTLCGTTRTMGDAKCIGDNSSSGALFLTMRADFAFSEKIGRFVFGASHGRSCCRNMSKKMTPYTVITQMGVSFIGKTELVFLDANVTNTYADFLHRHLMPFVEREHNGPVNCILHDDNATPHRAVLFNTLNSNWSYEVYAGPRALLT